MFCLEIFILDDREKKGTENQQLFDGIIYVTLFEGVEGLDYYIMTMKPKFVTK